MFLRPQLIAGSFSDWSAKPVVAVVLLVAGVVLIPLIVCFVVPELADLVAGVTTLVRHIVLGILLVPEFAIMELVRHRQGAVPTWTHAYGAGVELVDDLIVVSVVRPLQAIKRLTNGGFGCGAAFVCFLVAAVWLVNNAFAHQHTDVDLLSRPIVARSAPLTVTVARARLHSLPFIGHSKLHLNLSVKNSGDSAFDLSQSNVYITPQRKAGVQNTEQWNDGGGWKVTNIQPGQSINEELIYDAPEPGTINLVLSMTGVGSSGLNLNLPVHI